MAIDFGTIFNLGAGAATVGSQIYNRNISSRTTSNINQSFADQAKLADKATQARNKALDLQRKMADVQNVRQARELVRTANYARAVAIQEAIGTGAGVTSSTAQGATASIGSQLGANLSYINRLDRLNDLALQQEQRAAEFTSKIAQQQSYVNQLTARGQEKTATANMIGNIGSTIFDLTGGYKSLANNIFGVDMGLGTLEPALAGTSLAGISLTGATTGLTATGAASQAGMLAAQNIGLSGATAATTEALASNAALGATGGSGFVSGLTSLATNPMTWAVLGVFAVSSLFNKKKKPAASFLTSSDLKKGQDWFEDDFSVKSPFGNIGMYGADAKGLQAADYKPVFQAIAKVDTQIAKQLTAKEKKQLTKTLNNTNFKVSLREGDDGTFAEQVLDRRLGAMVTSLGWNRSKEIGLTEIWYEIRKSKNKASKVNYNAWLQSKKGKV